MAEPPSERDPSSHPPRPDSGRWDEATDHLWRALQAIYESTRFADTKAAVVLTADGVLATLATGMVERHWDVLGLHRGCKVALMIGGVLLLASAISCVKCIFPRVRVKGQARSLLFFHHIALDDDPKSYLTRAGTLSEPDVAFREVGTQVWANAKVAREKFKEVAFAIGATGAGLVAALFVWIVAVLDR